MSKSAMHNLSLLSKFTLECRHCRLYPRQVILLMNDRAKPGQAYVPTDVEHIANMVTHGVWILPTVAGTLWMLYLADNTYEKTSAVVYGLALLTLFSVSTIFHTISYTGKCQVMKNFFHIGDRAVIYIFIAAAYTPWLLLKDLGHMGMYMITVVWLMAALGIGYQYTFHEQYKWLETLLYLIIGILPSFVIFGLMKETAGIYELSMGGIAYIVGVIFFKCDGLLPFAHAIWHCFVVLGSMYHYYAVCVHLLGNGEIQSPDLAGSEIPDIHDSL